jgi:predicted secreted protein
MATAGVINGTNLRFYVAGDVVGHATSCTMSLSMEIRETLDKDSVSGYAGGAAGQRSGSLSFEGLGSEDIVLNAADVASMATLLTQFSSDTAFAWKFTTDATGDVSVTGNGLISDISISAAVEENATLSGTVTMIGAPTFGTVA